MIKAILLDLGGVIVELDFARAYRATAELTGLDVEEVPERIRRAGLAEPYEHGRISSEEFYRRLSAALGLRVSYKRFCEIWGDMFGAEPLLERSFLAALRKRYRLLLLSNTNELHFEWLRRRFPLLKEFDDYVLSYEVGSMKPAPEIYLEAVGRAGCETAECFFADDKPENIEAATRLGMHGALFTSGQALRSELRGHGVRC